MTSFSQMYCSTVKYCVSFELHSLNWECALSFQSEKIMINSVKVEENKTIYIMDISIADASVYDIPASNLTT